MKNSLWCLVGLATMACASSNPSPGAESSRPEPAPGLALAPLAGQRIPVLPLTFLVAEVPADEFLPPDRVARLAWADSLIGEMLLEHGPEVEWVLPPELRRIAARAPNMITDPDRMGQAIMRSPRLDILPDPLRSYLRALSAMSDARLVMIPAAVRFTADSGGIQAEVVMVMADTRNGRVIWRSHPAVVGDTPAAALRASIAHILPDLD